MLEGELLYYRRTLFVVSNRHGDPVSTGVYAMIQDY